MFKRYIPVKHDKPAIIALHEYITNTSHDDVISSANKRLFKRESKKWVKYFEDYARNTAHHNYSEKQIEELACESFNATCGFILHHAFDRVNKDHMTMVVKNIAYLLVASSEQRDDAAFAREREHVIKCVLDLYRDTVEHRCLQFHTLIARAFISMTGTQHFITPEEAFEQCGRDKNRISCARNRQAFFNEHKQYTCSLFENEKEFKRAHELYCASAFARELTDGMCEDEDPYSDDYVYSGEDDIDA